MKAEVLVKQEVEITTLEVKAGVRYWEDSEFNGENDTEDGELVPCKIGSLWCPIIDIDSGIITNWKHGVKAEIHYKVVDNGSYYLKDSNGNVIASIEHDYVPKILCPKKNGYGDYIIMDVDENGKISNWKQDISSFFPDIED